MQLRETLLDSFVPTVLVAMGGGLALRSGTCTNQRIFCFCHGFRCFDSVKLMSVRNDRTMKEVVVFPHARGLQAQSNAGAEEWVEQCIML